MDEGNISFGTWLGITIVIIVVWFMAVNSAKFDGLTAEEWADESSSWEEKYESFRSCVEDYDNFSISRQISYGGVFYYCE